jgi:hypothetical protein
MEQNPLTAERPLHIPPVVWFLGVGLVIALIAVFVFKVAVGTVAYYGLFAFMMGSHFFMHGSHGGHGGFVGHQHGPASSAAEDQPDKNERSGHNGGCH